MLVLCHVGFQINSPWFSPSFNDYSFEETPNSIFQDVNHSYVFRVHIKRDKWTINEVRLYEYEHYYKNLPSNSPLLFMDDLVFFLERLSIIQQLKG